MYIKFQLKYFLLLISFIGANTTFAQTESQTLPFQKLSTEDISQFETTKSKSWQIAGNVNADRKVEGNLEIKSGKGILVYSPGKTRQIPLISKSSYGDIDLEIDFLLSKGASFSILLQNHYEVLVTDSWMKKGDYAAKAPGLWQHLSIHFKAPKFDNNNKKTGNARFDQIRLNGQEILKPGDVVLSSKSPYKEETRMAPFAISGNSYAFAIKNIQYKTYENERIQLSDITFKVYQGLHKNPDTLKALKPKRIGTTDTISHLVGDRKSQLFFEGFVNIPRDGDYLFKLIAGGGAWFYVDNKLLIDNRGSRDFEKAFYAKHKLSKGKYPFKIIYSNSDECLVLHYEGPQIPWQSLSTPASVRLSERFEPLEYEVKNKPILQRGFMMHHEKVNPYTAAIGLPSLSKTDDKSGNNYAYDMKKYNLLSVWHGRFIDVSNMWRERGEKQMEIPLGAKLELHNKPLLAMLEYANSSWPDSVQAPEGTYTSRGYKLNNSGLPAFYYSVDQVNVEDFIYSTTNNDGLIRDLKIKNTGSSKLYYCLLAEGKVIEKLADGGYAIDDKSYYIENPEITGSSAIIRKDKDVDQLIVPLLPQNELITIKYNIIW